jgi:hypothetical protein
MDRGAKPWSKALTAGRSVMRLLSLAIFFAIALNANSCLAEDCDISRFKDELSYTKDIMTNPSYIDRVASRLDRTGKEGTNIKFLDIASLDYNQASTLSSSLQRLLNIQWSQRDQE